jgi:hypothetical protein
MNRAWSNLNRNTPDLKAAQADAAAALALVPYWHYVRDILIPQIQEAHLNHTDLSRRVGILILIPLSHLTCPV